MPSIDQILNVLPGYQSERDAFNRRVNQSGWDTANEMLLHALSAVGTGIPAGEPMMLSADAPKGIAPRVAEPMPRSTEGLSLSQNLMPKAPPGTDFLGQNFHYKIFKDGQELGYAHGNVRGGLATIDNIDTGQGTLGVQGLKQLREQLRQDFPKATTFEGLRISGARAGPASDPNNRDWFQTVKIPAVLAAILGSNAASNNGGQQ
jgi:hypothetical protein